VERAQSNHLGSLKRERLDPPDPDELVINVAIAGVHNVPVPPSLLRPRPPDGRLRGSRQHRTGHAPASGEPLSLCMISGTPG
jgi:hypothetical protein